MEVFSLIGQNSTIKLLSLRQKMQSGICSLGSYPFPMKIDGCDIKTWSYYTATKPWHHKCLIGLIK